MKSSLEGILKPNCGSVSVGLVAAHLEAIPLFEYLLEQSISFQLLVTLPEYKLSKKSAGTSLKARCIERGIDVLEVEDINSDYSVSKLTSYRLDVLLVVGWSQILSTEALKTARLGCFGTHASFLPKFRGSAPLNWALIANLPKTGNTLMRLSEGVDEGHIVDQHEIEIRADDNIRTLYQKVAISNLELFKQLLKKLGKNELLLRDTASSTALLPRRKPEDGKIDWNWSAFKVERYVRALCRPYPGAFTEIQNKKITIHCAKVIEKKAKFGAAGEIIYIDDKVLHDLTLVVCCGAGTIQLSALSSECNSIGFKLGDTFESQENLKDTIFFSRFKNGAFG